MNMIVRNVAESRLFLQSLTGFGGVNEGVREFGDKLLSWWIFCDESRAIRVGSKKGERETADKAC